MKKILLCFLTLLTGSITYANNISISGKVVDSKTQKAMPFATVSLTEDNTEILVAGAVTNLEGRFEIMGDFSGTYIVRLSFIGYEVYSETILIGELNQYFDLGKIELSPSLSSIDEVTITAQKSVISSGMESKSFEMDDNIAQSGGSVLDAMRAMPGITVDQEGKVILRGSDKVVVLIDGKQSALTGFGNQKGLDNIPVNNIERIEIINNPSAKYDASGMAGIINIIYKKEKEDGLNGDISFTYGLGALTKPKADLPTDLGSYSANPKYIPGLNLNYRKDKLNFFLQSEAMFLNHLPNNEFTTRYYDDNRITASQVPENRTQQHYIFKGGMDYLIDEQNILSFSGVYDWEHHYDTAQVPYIDMLTHERYRYISWKESETTGFMNYALHYKHKFAQAGHELEFLAQYTKGWEDETYFINDSSSVRQGGRDVTNILATEHTTQIQTDYTKPLRSGRIESGAKFSIRSLPVEYTVDPGLNSIIYPGLGEWSKWGENIYAAYANLIFEKPVYELEAGLRAEYTDVYYDFDQANIYYNQNDAYNYFKLFPNIRLSFKLNAGNKISIFYNRRVDRPGEPELRIFAKSDDHELLKIGNPYLRPQFTQTFEAGYKTKWKTGSAFLAGYYRIIDEPYMRVYTADNTNPLYDVLIKTYANTGSANNAGLELVISQKLLSFWKLSGNVNYYKNKIAEYQGTLFFPTEQTFQIIESSENTWNAKLNNQFDLANDLSLQLTGIYMAPKNIPQGRELARASLDIGIKKKVFNNRGELSLSATDIFNSNGIRQEITAEGFRVEYRNYYETQVVRMGLRYRF
jgi:outer membrane receptor protein involved in Fe transport